MQVYFSLLHIFNQKSFSTASFVSVRFCGASQLDQCDLQSSHKRRMAHICTLYPTQFHEFMNTVTFSLLFFILFCNVHPNNPANAANPGVPARMGKRDRERNVSAIKFMHAMWRCTLAVSLAKVIGILAILPRVQPSRPMPSFLCDHFAIQ